MQEPHKKGLANRLDPESCSSGRAGEKWAGALWDGSPQLLARGGQSPDLPRLQNRA